MVDVVRAAAAGNRVLTRGWCGRGWVFEAPAWHPGLRRLSPGHWLMGVPRGCCWRPGSDAALRGRRVRFIFSCRGSFPGASPGVVPPRPGGVVELRLRFELRHLR